jgi:hypothetical protein
LWSSRNPFDCDALKIQNFSFKGFQFLWSSWKPFDCDALKIRNFSFKGFRFLWSSRKPFDCDAKKCKKFQFQRVSFFVIISETFWLRCWKNPKWKFRVSILWSSWKPLTIVGDLGDNLWQNFHFRP